MKNVIALMLTIAVLCIMATSVVAGEREGAFSISPYVGGYSFDGDQHLESAPVFGLRLGYDLTKNWGVEAVADYVNTEDTISNKSINSLSYRLDILYNFMPDGPMVPYLAVGGGGVTYGHGSDGLKISERTTSATINAGLGIKHFVTDSIAFRADVRQLLVLEKPDSPKYNREFTAGVTFLLGGKKEVTKPVEPPPPAPAPAPAPIPVVAPAPPADSDGDGVIDDADKCPNTPAGVKVDANGCPLDSDGDGVADHLDKCPNTPNGVAVGNDGCPLDSDGDGVADYLDKCPDTPKAVAVNDTGCPLDADEDGVPDYLDKCADTPKNKSVNKDGCPPPDEKLCILLDVEFDTNKADIKSKYNDELKKVGDFLNEYPTATGVIEGYSDNVGKAAYNLKLSQKRADSVRNCSGTTFCQRLRHVKAGCCQYYRSWTAEKSQNKRYV